MGDRVFFVGLALIAAGMMSLAMAWPQGLGRPSPTPFGHPLAPLAPRASTPPP
jgi:hypothetical protein